jgi:hypothetical protein
MRKKPHDPQPQTTPPAPTATPATPATPATTAAREKSAVETAADRRRSPRATHRVMFNMRPLLSSGMRGGLIEVILQDLSICGMGIIHTSAMRQGEQYEVPLLRGDAAPAAAVLLATVVRCEQLDDELFSIGFEFNSSIAVVDEGSRQLTGHPAPRD